MFERFTDEARAVVVEAQAECRRRHDRAIGPEHLLLGLWCADSAAVRALEHLGLHADELRDELPRTLSDAEALRVLGIDIDEVRRRVEAAFGPGALDSGTAASATLSSRRIPFTPEAKRALELSLRAALELGHRSIGPEHVLLGIVQTGDAGVTYVLDRHGVGPDDVHRAVLDKLADAA